MQPNYQQLGTAIGGLVDRKNTAYGSSFSKSADFLRLLWPDGVPVDRYADMQLLVRIFDKQMRIATDRDALGESPYADIAGYGLLGARQHEERKKQGCGSASLPDAAEESTEPGSSAAPGTASSTTPNASERSAASSAKPSSSPSQPGFASTAAPVPSAMGAASESAEDLEVHQLNRLGLCANKRNCPTHQLGSDLIVTGTGLIFCDAECMRLFQERRA